MVTRHEPIVESLEVFERQPFAGAAEDMTGIWSGRTNGAEATGEIVAALRAACGVGALAFGSVGEGARGSC